ncbi:helix-turn-helix transcriptional regulator [Pseudarthrobacter sp. P1]|uniref:helix-turn-helix transcriptional regulator n=1 Tax=Pseudarthrobacter sp. P1 TaxID=3418418 RepID=UPI003CE852BE
MPAKKIDTIERLLNLVIALLGSRDGHDKGFLRANIRGYDPQASDEAFERMFDRDKINLKKLGIPMQARQIHTADDPNTWTYRIAPEEYRLPEIRLDDASLAVLGLAAQVWEQATLGSAAMRALRKLENVTGRESMNDGGAVQSRIRTEDPSFDGLWDALRDSHPVTFSYRRSQQDTSTVRSVQPWGLGNKYGQWYLSGLDVPSGEPRLFRLSRITSEVSINTAATFERPADFDIATVLDTLGTGQEYTAVVEVRAGTAALLREDATTSAPAARGGWDRLEIPYREPELMAGDLATLGPGAVVVGPAALHDAVLSRLHAAAGAALEGPAEVDFSRKPRAKNGRPSTEDRLRRLLDLVPFLVQNPGIDKDEAAGEFGISRAELQKDLDQLSVCGLPGGYHGDLIDVGWEEDVVFIRDVQKLDKPLRLTQEEACAMLVGLESLRALPNADGGAALERVLADVRAIAGDQGWLADAVEARITADADLDTIATLQELVRTRGCADITYLVPLRDETTQRVIEPLRVFSVDSRWYVQAWCQRANGKRIFRLSNIKSIQALAEPAPDRGLVFDSAVPSTLFTPRDEDAEVVLVLDASAGWVADAYAAEAVAALPGGGTAVRIRTAKPQVVATLMAKLGGAGRVASPPHVAEAVAAWLREALANYAGEPNRDSRTGR